MNITNFYSYLLFIYFTIMNVFHLQYYFFGEHNENNSKFSS